ncbi:hypothetical protein [Amycolatopsis sp.]|uniref:hypothetical protein n=1 Tax=Amycolatopsis sp. TaxID=37632 RepID=UPI002D7F8169|nr:hypothetical protein [Amycolatopsis sp.]HET6706075.1 hypothetical protein [Amycolatopsis sp.]
MLEPRSRTAGATEVGYGHNVPVISAVPEPEVREWPARRGAVPGSVAWAPRSSGVGGRDMALPAVAVAA